MGATYISMSAIGFLTSLLTAAAIGGAVAMAGIGGAMFLNDMGKQQMAKKHAARGGK